MRANHVNGLFVKIPQSLIRSDAFAELSTYAKLAVFLIDMIYWEGGRSNPMAMSQKNFAHWIGSSVRTAQTVLTELDDHGFLVREHAGSLKGQVADRTAVYRISWLCDSSGHPRKNDFKKFSRVKNR